VRNTGEDQLHTGPVSKDMLCGLACALCLCYAARDILPEESALSSGELYWKRKKIARKEGKTVSQITIGNSATVLQLAEPMPDGLGWWVEQYFRFEVTTGAHPLIL